MTYQVVPGAVHATAMKTKPPRAKKSLAQAFNDERFMEACRKRGADPLDVIARIISDKYCGDIPLDKRGEIALRALKFVMAEKKAVEHTGADGGPVRHSVEVHIVDVEG